MPPATCGGCEDLVDGHFWGPWPNRTDAPPTRREGALAVHNGDGHTPAACSYGALCARLELPHDGNDGATTSCFSAQPRYDCETCTH